MAIERRALCEALGGVEVMRAILEDFYARLFDDPMVGFLFAGRDRAALVERQLQFTGRAFGGTLSYEGRSLPDAHAPLPILPGHFDRRHVLLAKTLEAHHVAPELRDAWLEFERSFREVILSASRRGGTMG